MPAQNRDLTVKLQRLQDEAKRSESPTGRGSPTYSLQKAQVKADEDAQAEIAKYKKLFDGGVTRIARLQQDNEKVGREGRPGLARWRRAIAARIVRELRPAAPCRSSRKRSAPRRRGTSCQAK